MDSYERACVRSEGAAVDRNDRLRYVSGQTRSTTTGLCGITEIMIPRLIRETNSNSVIVVIGLLVDSRVQGGSHTLRYDVACAVALLSVIYFGNTRNDE